MEFGSGFGSYYSGWDDWVKEYPQVDKEAYPALFTLPDDCYEICLMKPCADQPRPDDLPTRVLPCHH
eukprot:5541856-Prymnesium_polylepis.1